MSKPIPKPALGSLDGLRIIGRPDFFPQYGIKLLENRAPADLDDYLTIHVVRTTSRVHYFHAYDKADLNTLCEMLSRIAQTEVKVACKDSFQTLKGWHRGQVVIGQRSLKDLGAEINNTLNAKSKF